MTDLLESGPRHAGGRRRPVVNFFRVTGGLVAAVLTPEGNAAAAYLLRDSGGSVRLGRFSLAISGQDGGLLAYDSRWDRPPGLLAAFTSTGRLRWQRRVAEPTDIVADTPYGLLVHVLNDQPEGGPLRLVDARTGALRRGIGRAISVLASDGRFVAWIGGPCPDEGGCLLQVTDLRTDRTVGYAPPLERTPSIAAFSPDGRLLALGVTGLPEWVPGIVRDGFAGVLDLRDRRFTQLPGLTTGEKNTPILGWSPDGGWLLMAVQDADDREERVVMWRVGDRHLTVLPTVLPGSTMASGGPGLVVRP